MEIKRPAPAAEGSTAQSATPSGEKGIDDKTIADFGEQWTAFTRNDGYYGSTDLFADIAGPLMAAEKIADAACADIGSGTGRIVRMLVELGAASVLAVEPSAAANVLHTNTRDIADRVTIFRGRGDALPASGDKDLIVSFGVLHHIVDPHPTVTAAFGALKPGGQLLIWVYGHEGNELYLALTTPLRAVTTRLPHWALTVLSWSFSPILWLYGQAARIAPLPMRGYFIGHLNRLSWAQRALTVYDQLNPAHAKYYRRAEVEQLLKSAGFVNVRLYHRHGYSWTALGEKPPGTV